MTLDLTMGLAVGAQRLSVALRSGRHTPRHAGKTSRETAQLPPIIAACHQQHLASTLREQLTLPVRLAYAIWVAIVHFRVDYYPHEVGFGTHPGEPPKVAGPLQGRQARAEANRKQDCDACGLLPASLN